MDEGRENFGQEVGEMRIAHLPLARVVTKAALLGSGPSPGPRETRWEAMTCGPYRTVELCGVTTKTLQGSYVEQWHIVSALPAAWTPEVGRCCWLQARKHWGEDLEFPWLDLRSSSFHTPRSLLSAVCAPIPGAGTSPGPHGLTTPGGFSQASSGIG